MNLTGIWAAIAEDVEIKRLGIRYQTPLAYHAELKIKTSGNKVELEGTSIGKSGEKTEEWTIKASGDIHDRYIRASYIQTHAHYSDTIGVFLIEINIAGTKGQGLWMASRAMNESDETMDASYPIGFGHVKMEKMGPLPKKTSITDIIDYQKKHNITI